MGSSLVNFSLVRVQLARFKLQTGPPLGITPRPLGSGKTYLSIPMSSEPPSSLPSAVRADYTQHKGLYNLKLLVRPNKSRITP